MATLRRNDLIYPDLSYKIIGCAFDVYNSLGSGHHEKYYQRALEESFRQNNINYKQQVYFPLQYRGKIIGKNFLDFLVEDKIVVEIKKDNKYSKRHINQVMEYLKMTDTKLTILINFGSDSVNFKRVVNFNS